MLKGASRVQIPPSPSDGSEARRGARRRLERRALRRRAAPARRRRRDRRSSSVSSQAASARTTPAFRRRRCCRPTEALAAARIAPGAAEAITGAIDVERVLWWRDQVTDGRDDSWHAGWLADQGAELVRGDARVVRPGVVAVGERELEYDELVVATGSEPALPPLDGLADVEYWTNREADLGERDSRQSHRARRRGRRCRARAVLPAHGLRRHDRRAQRSPAGASRPRRRHVARRAVRGGRDPRPRRDAGPERRDHRRAASGCSSPRERRSTRSACSWRPVGGRTSHELGLEQLGVEVTRRGVTVDDRLRAGDGVWAIGDAAGVGLLTHLGKYQARVAAANIAGRDVRADYRAIPAAVFTDPQVASVGAMDGDDVVTARYEIVGGRLSTYERPRRPGFVKLAADRRRRVLVGAVAVGPEAGEWLGQLTLAVRAEVPARRPARHDPAVPDVLGGSARLDCASRRGARGVLLDAIQPYPTFSEAIFNALRELELSWRRRGDGRLSGEGGIRTLDERITTRNALAGRRLQPLGHLSRGRSGYRTLWPGLVARLRRHGYPMPPTEGCRSGRTGRSRKPLGVQAPRGFKSLPLRLAERSTFPMCRGFGLSTLLFCRIARCDQAGNTRPDAR